MTDYFLPNVASVASKASLLSLLTLCQDTQWVPKKTRTYNGFLLFEKNLLHIYFLFFFDNSSRVIAKIAHTTFLMISICLVSIILPSNQQSFGNSMRQWEPFIHNSNGCINRLTFFQFQLDIHFLWWLFLLVCNPLHVTTFLIMKYLLVVQWFLIVPSAIHYPSKQYQYFNTNVGCYSLRCIF